MPNGANDRDDLQHAAESLLIGVILDELIKLRDERIGNTGELLIVLAVMDECCEHTADKRVCCLFVLCADVVFDERSDNGGRCGVKGLRDALYDVLRT